MNKEEYAIDEKTYENYDGLKIKIIFSNLGRRYMSRPDLPSHDGTYYNPPAGKPTRNPEQQVMGLRVEFKQE